jgi:hypothetical protein
LNIVFRTKNWQAAMGVRACHHVMSLADDGEDTLTFCPMLFGHLPDWPCSLMVPPVLMVFCGMAGAAAGSAWFFFFFNYSTVTDLARLRG